MMGRQEQFVYDSTGNIIQLDDITLSYGVGDRLQRRGACQYEYDGNGRLIRKIEPGTPEPKVWLFGWDAEDQLRLVTTPSGEVWQYQYDALGRRIVKQGPDSIRFVWDGDVVAHEVEQDTAQSYWVFDPDSFAPLAKVEQGQLYAVICDHLGTPKELLDNQGRVVWALNQRAWGEVEQVRVEEVACPIRFQGQWADAETGLYYNRFRFYEPGSGQFINQDPIGLIGGLNNYQYVQNPVEWIDPLGLMAKNCKSGHSYPDMDTGVNSNRFRDKKAHRKEVAEAIFSAHGNKHTKAKTIEEAIKFSSNRGAAQYVPGVNNKALEKLATQKGIVVKKPGLSGTKYFFYESDDVVGYDSGKPTRWIRAEITSGTYHGHPISEARLLSQYGIK